MTLLKWDEVGQRFYETGVDRGVLYIPNSAGVYDQGFAWNGLVSVSEAPSGAEASPQYADNIKYLNLVSAEEFGATIEAFTYPDEFAQCDGTATPAPGVSIGQQSRKLFGLSYRTKIGNDVDTELGYKIHLIYGALAAPTEKAYTTVNDSPEAITFSWEVTTTQVGVPGFKSTAQLTIDSTKVDETKLADLEELLWGGTGVNPQLPSPGTVIGMFNDTIVEVAATKPTQTGNDITIPTIVGVTYLLNGEAVEGVVTITEDVVITAAANSGYQFPAVSDNDWYFEYSAV